MGLDMYLTGEIFFTEYPANGKEVVNIEFDGMRLKSGEVELGYWRKQPDLHGFIVENFAEGVDDCRSIFLGTECLGTIIEAIKTDKLPLTDGFFFGENDNSEEAKKRDIKIFEDALEWLEKETKYSAWKSITYRASW